MVEGTGLSLYMLIGAIMFGLFAGAILEFSLEGIALNQLAVGQKHVIEFYHY